MSDPSTDKKDEPEATAESSLEPLAVTSTHVFPNLREDQVGMAMKFLSDPRTIASTSSRAQKEQFLRTKGLTDAEINASFQRLDASANPTSVPSTPTQALPSGVQLQPVYFPPPPSPPLPPSEPTWLSLLKTVVGAGTALMAGWWLFSRVRQDQQQQQRHAEVTEASSERERLLMELLARETERKKEGEREGRSAVENSADSRDDRVVKMLEEMQRNQLKQHADLIMALKEITAASLSRSEARTGGEGLIVKAGGVVMDDVDDEEEEERGVDRSVVVTTDSTAVGSEAAANTAESGEKKDLEEVVREMDDRMKGTAKMLLGNLVNNPKSDKFRRVNLRTPRFQAQLDTGSAARKLMEEVGFKEEGSYLVWSPSTREGDCEDELGEVKKALALLSGEVKEDGPNGTSTRDAEKTSLPWMSTAVAATTTTTTKVAKGGSSSGSEEGGGGLGSLSD